MSVLLKLTRIVQAAAEADSPAVQVKLIVDGIQREMDVDVCTLYLTDDRSDMALVASHGLGDGAIGRAVIPRGQGLVGSVAETRHPINVVDPAAHPAFLYVPGSGEERYCSFCGIPLIRAGEVVGVLVVQRKDPNKLSAEEEAFLVTVGAQLALILANWHDWDVSGIGAPRSFPGIKGAPGIGIGAARLCKDLDIYSVVDAPCADREAELLDWRRLVERVKEEVRSDQLALGDALSNEVAGIFDAYILLLSDTALLSGVEQGIRGGQSLPSALRAVIHHFAELFAAMDDPYLRARHEDIRHLGNRLYSTWRKTHTGEIDIEPDGPVVLVGSLVSVSDVAAVPREHLAGIVCFQGSALSHTAVLASALGIPAILGVGHIKGLRDGDGMLVDGNAARVFLNPEPFLVDEYMELIASERQLREQLRELRDKPAVTVDGSRVTLYANSGLMADITPGLENGAEGLGLYRTEIPFMISETFPSEEEQVLIYRQVMEAYRGKPVHMRILDVGADKPLPYFPVQEDNPVLGWRGIRFCLDNTSLLMTQLRAMLRSASRIGNLRLLVPMVSAEKELRRFHAILADAVSQLRQEGEEVLVPEVGIMVEVPAAISQLPKWRQLIDFISIGSNDLSQYLIAVDRNNPRVSSAYDHLHPSVLDEIVRIVKVADQLDLPVSLCGEMSSDPDAVVLLLGMGIRTLSLSAAQLPRIKCESTV
jgi:phosphoenolpyruvate-protein phosphotransferase